MRPIVCPRCHRRFNAHGLAPGAHVVCLCGEALDAGSTQEALAGDAEPSLRALQPLPPDAACPRCGGEVQLRLLEHGDLTECRACGGIWLAPESFEAVCRDAQDSPDFAFSATPSQPARVVPSTDAPIDCPCCAKRMTRRQFRHAGRTSGIVLDFCREHGVWLDHEELGGVVAFLRRESPGSSRPPAARVTARKKDGKPRSSNVAADAGLVVGELVVETIGELLGSIFG